MLQVFHRHSGKRRVTCTGMQSGSSSFACCVCVFEQRRALSYLLRENNLSFSSYHHLLCTRYSGTKITTADRKLHFYRHHTKRMHFVDLWHYFNNNKLIHNNLWDYHLHITNDPVSLLANLIQWRLIITINNFKLFHDHTSWFDMKSKSITQICFNFFYYSHYIYLRIIIYYVFFINRQKYLLLWTITLN